MRSLTCALLAFTACLALSCRNDRIPHGSTPDNSSESASLQFSIQLPGLVTKATIAGTPQENEVESIYLLAFRVADDGNEYYDYKVPATSISDGGVSHIKRFNATVLKRDYKQRFVLIVNATGAVNNLTYPSGDITKEQLLRDLEFAKADVWHATDDSGFTLIPMWGETNPIIVGDTDPVIDPNPVPVARMVSGIDVSLSSQQALDNFTLTSIHLYNRHTKGRVVPDRAAWDASGRKATQVTLPLADADKVRGPVKADAIVEPDTVYFPTLYTFEANGVDLDQSSGATAVVVGGVYKGDIQPTYYRIDFLEKDDHGNSTAHRPLLRNHMYRIFISSVSGSGYGTPDEAFDSRSVNLEADVLEWNQGDISDIVFDNQYMLGVSPGEFYLPRNEAGYSFTVITDVPAGWQIAPAENYDWLTLSIPAWSGVDEKDTVPFRVKENDTGAERTALIVITAGRLSYTVKVVQSVTAALSLELLDMEENPITELFFRCHNEDGDGGVPVKSFKVVWGCPDEICMVSEAVIGASRFDPGQGDNPIGQPVLRGSSQNFDVRPKAMTDAELALNPFLTKSSRYNFVVESGGDVIAKSILIRQVHYELFGDVEESYIMDGSQYTFRVRSNAAWTATVKSSGNVIASVQTNQGGPDTGPGTEFHFTITDSDITGLSTGSGTITFTYTAEDGYVYTKDVVINGVAASKAEEVEGANSYIVIPGSDGISIPVGWANNSDNPNRIPNGAALTARLIWKDSSTPLGAGSVIKEYSIVGEGPDARLIVVPGSQEGNALIGVYAGTTLAWSWHIWVTDYDPETTAVTSIYNGLTFMSRNMGALTERGDARALGLLYQWGRKDPFPGLSAIQGSSAVPLYDAGSGSVQITTASASASDDNCLEASIQHPTAFYTGNSNNDGDWYSAKQNTHYDKAWSNMTDYTKTRYDPCPPGWRTPIDVSNTDRYDPFKDSWRGGWQSADYGQNFGDDHMGFFPGGGGQISATGAYTNTGNGYYWTAAVQNLRTYALLISSGSSYVGDYARSIGNSIRCIKMP